MILPCAHSQNPRLFEMRASVPKAFLESGFGEGAGGHAARTLPNIFFARRLPRSFCGVRRGVRRRSLPKRPLQHNSADSGTLCPDRSLSLH